MTPLRAVICVACLSLLPVGRATAHPGQHVGLKITIDDQVVRLEILLSNDFLSFLIPRDRSGLDLRLAGDAFEFADRAQAEGERAAFNAVFGELNVLSIDGVEVEPILAELTFIPAADASGAVDPALPPDLRVVQRFPGKGRPRQVAVIWGVFPEDYSVAAGLGEPVEIVAELDAYDENTLITFTPEEPEVIWHAPRTPAVQRVMPVVVSARPATLAVPAVSLASLVIWAGGWGLRRMVGRRSAPRLAVGGSLVLALAVALLCRNLLVLRLAKPWATPVALPDEQAAAGVFTALHRNVYRAFDYKSESDVYDVLARSVDGDLLDQVYFEIYESLVMRDQGGAVARVQSVDVLETELVSAGLIPGTRRAAFQMRSRWRVHGVVYHWGHVHARTNEYDALYTVAQREDQWKITGVKPLGQRRVVTDGEGRPAGDGSDA